MGPRCDISHGQSGTGSVVLETIRLSQLAAVVYLQRSKIKDEEDSKAQSETKNKLHFFFSVWDGAIWSRHNIHYPCWVWQAALSTAIC